ncbi:hypothetical protein C4D60_Mb10t04910 [Musa balbisiana]|uniref:Fungal lipase-type domain-containing protein n=1 Tax=Musa balbisiana TaxID=52838 RepID=A0A4S8IUQ2_MUSBA|nr:hypothetical protein C4D60_Mb10t04910 [Musa balbisiana]
MPFAAGGASVSHRDTSLPSPHPVVLIRFVLWPITSRHVKEKTRYYIMASEKDLFDISGPLHITSVNWKCSHHRRSVAACLVQGAYVSELDRQHNRKGQEAFAPPWWEFFQFELTSNLIDDADSSVFGAIYEFKPASSKDSSVQDAPKFVVAFRGTIPSKESLAQDGLLDINIIQNGLHRTPRFAIAMRAVQNIVSAAKSSNVWLAGHSLGAAIATLAGKNMAKMGILDLSLQSTICLCSNREDQGHKCKAGNSHRKQLYHSWT